MGSHCRFWFRHKKAASPRDVVSWTFPPEMLNCAIGRFSDVSEGDLEDGGGIPPDSPRTAVKVRR